MRHQTLLDADERVYILVMRFYLQNLMLCTSGQLSDSQGP